MSRLVFGVGPVQELLDERPGAIELLYVADSKKRRSSAGPISKMIVRARRCRIDVQIRPRAELDQLAGPAARHQGVIAVAGDFEYVDLDDILGAADASGRAPLVVAADGVTDPRNLGAIIRSAQLFGAHGLVIPQDRSATVTAVTTKASAGATEYLPVARVTNLSRALGELKEAGLWTAALATAPDAVPIWELDAAAPTCLVLGAEGKGIRKLVARSCDFRVEIPMLGQGIGSLNVAVAAGVALYEITRQRKH